MMKRALIAAALTAFVGTAVAQDCAAPLVITSQGGTADSVEGDTCAAGNPLPGMGGTPSPHNDVVYSFVAETAEATIAMGGAGTGAVFLLPSPCAVGTDPIAIGAPGGDMPVTGLTDGQTYYVVATSDPGTPAATCGAFTLDVTGQLPVELQNFSVE